MPGPCSFSSFPLELLELTASYLDARHDIISFASTCQRCNQATVPRYSEYRTVSCHYRRSHVWEHLQARPDLARNIRDLSVICDGPPASMSERFPFTLLKGYDPDEDSALSPGEQLVLVAHAISKMSALVNFSWTTDLHFEMPDEQEAEAAIWRAISQCKRLRHLHFSEPYNHRLLFTHDTYTHSEYPIWSISSLESISLINAPFLWNQQAAPHFETMLANCPNLEKLSIKMNHRECVVDPIFNCNWPKLKTLSLLIYADSPVHTESFSKFVDAHDTIENLEWEYLAPENLTSASLPLLRHLRGRDDTSAIVNLLEKSLKPRNLASLGLIPLNTRFMNLLELVDPFSLRTLELRFFDSLQSIRKVADMFPSLTHLQVPRVDYLYAYKTATTQRVTLDEWMHVLGFFHNLVVFNGVSFLEDPLDSDSDTHNDEIAQHLVHAVPKLKRIDHWDATSGSVIVLNRTEAGDIKWEECVPRKLTARDE